MDPASFPPIDAAQARAIIESLDAEAFHVLLGLRFEEVRLGYARVRLRHRPELLQAGGVVHGGVIASVLDTVVVGAILSMLPGRPRRLGTIDLDVHYLEAVSDEDIIAEGRVRRRGKSIIFVEMDARTPSGRELAHGEAAWRISS